MDPSEQIDEKIAKHPDWRGSLLTEARRIILAADPEIEETFKWMGSPVWEKDGILVVGDIFTSKVKLGFMYGASLDDPAGLFNGELGGKQRRSVEFAEGDVLREAELTDLVRAAIRHNHERRAAKK